MGRIITLRTTLACNQGCDFCHFRQHESPEYPSADLLKKLEDGKRSGATTVRFSGGEPFMDSRLPVFIRRAKQLRFSDIEVETNGTILAREGVIEKLKGLGVTRLWVALMHPDPAENDALTRTPGSADLTWETLRLAEGKISLGLSVAVLPENAPALGTLLDRVHEVSPSLTSVRFNVVSEGHETYPYDRLEAGLKKACARARKHRMDFRFESAFAPPPCVFSERFVTHQLPLYGSYYATENSVDGRRMRLAGCEACEIEDRCPGIHREIGEGFPDDLPSEPLSKDLVVALRGQLGGEGRSQRTQVSTVNLLRGSPGEAEKINLRVNWACNQRCRFCWVDFDWTQPTREALFSQLAEARAAGYTWVALTGGEPTLVPWLKDALAYANELGFKTIQIQSNGVHLAQESILQPLVSAGLTHALISLHGASAEVSDAITQAPGTWESSVRGVDALVAANCQVSLSHVLTEKNVHETVNFAAFVGHRWKGKVEIVWSVAAPITDATERYEDGIVSFDRAAVPLKEGLETCLELGVGFGGQNDTCGVPACVLNNDPRFVVPIPDIQRNAEKDFVFPAVCGTCTLQGSCRGVRVGYVKRFGEAGLHPVM